MVKILVFIPRLDMKNRFAKVIAGLPAYENIKIEQIHVFGTPQSLAQDRDADIMVVRGMTYDYLHAAFPNKHMIQIQMTSFDIMDALIRCKEEYHPNRLALCLHNQEIGMIQKLEQLCEAKIDIYDVWDEDSANRIIEEARKIGTDVFVGAGTVCGLCDSRGIPRVHIETKDAAIEAALRDAVNTARTINLERMKANLMHMILNNSEDSIIAINKEGKILATNNQTYRMFHLPVTEDVTNKSIDAAYQNFNWKASIRGNKKMEEVIEMYGKKYYVEYRPIVVDAIESGTIIITKSADQIVETETKIRRSLSERGLTAKYTFQNIIGSSPALQEDIRMAKRYSRVDANVLIIGETGTGKELFAHSIHQESDRRSQPFVALNCAALPENLLESELFGYDAGAFSGASKGGKIGLFELAHRGSIFLDEIGEIPISLQAKLLRVLQEKEIRRIGSDRVQPIDVRVISATNIDIEKQIQEGRFRSDLYYRLNLLDIIIPPLRERREDVQEMLDYFLSRFACESGCRIPKVSQKASAILKEYDWPGNVRELRNICEKLIVLNDKAEIGEEEIRQLKIFKQIQPAEKIKKTTTQNKEEIYSQLKPKKKKQDIAKELGVSRTTLWRMAKKQEELNQLEETREEKEGRL